MKEPELKEPELKDPELKEPELKEPELKEPELKEPELKEPELKETNTIILRQMQSVHTKMPRELKRQIRIVLKERGCKYSNLSEFMRVAIMEKLQREYPDVYDMFPPEQIIVNRGNYGVLVGE